MRCGYTGCLGELETRPAGRFDALCHDPETGAMWPRSEELRGTGFFVGTCTRCKRGYVSLDGVNFYCGVAPTKVLQATIEEPDTSSWEEKRHYLQRQS
jgi:hypothetical protein